MKKGLDEKADLKKVRDSYEAALEVLQPLEKRMRDFEPKMRAAKTQREKTKVQAAYLKAIKGLDKGTKQLAELDQRNRRRARRHPGSVSARWRLHHRDP